MTEDTNKHGPEAYETEDMAEAVEAAGAAEAPAGEPSELDAARAEAADLREMDGQDHQHQHATRDYRVPEIGKERSHDSASPPI